MMVLVPHKRKHHAIQSPVTVFTKTLDTNGAQCGGQTIIQAIPIGQISQSGSRIRVTLEGGSSEGLTINKLYVSQPATSGDAYDSHTDITQLFFSASASVVISAGGTATSDFATYALDDTKILLVCMEVANVGNDTPRAASSATGFTKYNKVAAEAGTQNRSTYNTDANTFFLVKTIEV